MKQERPYTLGDLKASGYRTLPVKDEIRRNLIRKIRDEEPLFPGIVGYEDSVVPQLVNALLSRHDFILLGLGDRQRAGSFGNSWNSWTLRFPFWQGVR